MKTQAEFAFEIVRLWHRLEPQAQQILLRIGQRLAAGQAEYGKMDVCADKRDFFKEAAEEALDFLVYYEMDVLREELDETGRRPRPGQGE